MSLQFWTWLSSKSSLEGFHNLLKSQIESGNPNSALVLFRQLLRSNVKPNRLTFSLLLKLASVQRISNPSDSIMEVSQIQAHLTKSGICDIVYVGTALLHLYMKMGQVHVAHNLFDYMPERDVVSWNALICGYSKNGYDFYALELFVQMRRNGVTPTSTTLACLLPSCGRHDLLFLGMLIHGFGIKSGVVALHLQVKNALASTYAKCGCPMAAGLLFEEMAERSVASWNTMISAYGQNGLSEAAMLVFREMVAENVEVNFVTLVSLLSANASPDVTNCYAVKSGLINDDSVITSLVCAYSRHGNVKSAELVHRSLQMENLISLTALISSYAEGGNITLVAEGLSHIQQLKMKLDSIAMITIIHAMKDPSHFNIGIVFHSYAIKCGLSAHTLVANGLITMYFKTNNVEAAFRLFAEMDDRSLISWNSVISGCVQAGMAREAMEFFCQMKMIGHNPDAITISPLLSACSQLGFLQLGKKLHNHILRTNIQVEDFVGTALIDMYAKCGSVVEAERVFHSIRKPCLATWNTMISAYSWYGLEQKALICYAQMQEIGLEPDKVTFLGLLAACVNGGLVVEGIRYFHAMRIDFGILPTLQHYACIVTLLGHACLFEDMLLFIKNMHIEPDSAVWGALLSACLLYHKVRLGECLAKKLYFLDCRNGGFYVLMSNLYAAAHRWEDVAMVREMMRAIGGDGCYGVSQIEMN